MGGILHRPEAISKNSCFQQPIETRELAGAFEQATISIPAERRREAEESIEPAKRACYPLPKLGVLGHASDRESRANSRLRSIRAGHPGGRASQARRSNQAARTTLPDSLPPFGTFR